VSLDDPEEDCQGRFREFAAGVPPLPTSLMAAAYDDDTCPLCGSDTLYPGSADVNTQRTLELADEYREATKPIKELWDAMLAELTGSAPMATWQIGMGPARAAYMSQCARVAVAKAALLDHIRNGAQET